ncbi:putative nucleoprotein [Changping Tick Virus 2]|uniref:Putative nucleoprotein n=1 Tax=Changping Tick Virus 2 TaxID=1608044 RepID=A0A0B5KR95_9VIRU|nr:putative nucleoprotein [Changping Tick Virus 2]AJG39046.1 putative nucleoprotein [Changping Tick Virus 2]
MHLLNRLFQDRLRLTMALNQAGGGGRGLQPQGARRRQARPVEGIAAADLAFARIRNRWDREDIVARGFTPVTILDKLYTESDYLSEDEEGVQAHLLVARGDAWLRKAEDPQTMTICLAVANAVTPGLNTLPIDEANDRVRACLREFFRKEITRRELVNVTEEVWNSWMRPQEGVREAGVLSPLAWLPRTREGLAEFEWPENVQPTQVRLLIEQLLTVATERVKNLAITSLFTIAYISFAKKGDITTRKLEAILNQVQQEIGWQVEVTPHLIQELWRQVGVHIPYASIPDMFRHWEGLMAGRCLRLRVTLEQAAWVGLTQYTTIVKMFSEHPGFPWDRVAAILPADWQNFQAAIEAVGNQPYYGFQANLGAAAGTKFPSLGYVAKEMMIKVGGREGDAIRRYKGWIETPRAKAALDALINAWDPVGLVEGQDRDPGSVAATRAALRRALEPAQPAAGQGAEG